MTTIATPMNEIAQRARPIVFRELSKHPIYPIAVSFEGEHLEVVGMNNEGEEISQRVRLSREQAQSSQHLRHAAITVAHKLRDETQ